MTSLRHFSEKLQWTKVKMLAKWDDPLSQSIDPGVLNALHHIRPARGPKTDAAAAGPPVLVPT